MNILFLTDLYPLSDEDFETPLVLKDFVCGLKQKNNNVQVIRPNFLLNSFVRGKKFYKTGFYEDVFNANYFTPFLFCVKAKLPEIKPYDVIVSHMPSGNIFANNFEGKLFCGVHYSDLEVLKNPIYSIYFKPQLLKAFRRAEKLLCRSVQIEKNLINLYPEFLGKTCVVNSGIDENNIVEKPIKFNHKIKVLTVSKLIKRKNIDKLILALKNVDNLELVIIGEGKEFKKLKKLDKKVQFKGRLNHQDVLKEMQKSDIFVLPSINETFGMVYLEAMASGCITVATRDDGFDGIIKDGVNGFLTKPDIESIRSTVLKIISSDNLDEICKNAYITAKNNTKEIALKNYIENINA